MAILAMCFDLMQEEIVAKFRWLGRKIGIVDEENASVDNSTDKNPRNTSANSSHTDQQTTVKSFEDESEYDNGWSSQRSGTGRKLSPRNNIARVHPLSAESNEGTLHQRATATPPKIN